MNRKSPPQPPCYGKHKPTGQARVQLGGRTVYLGKYGSAESHEAYQRVIAEWLHSDGKSIRGRQDFTVIELIVAYLRFAQGYYQKNGQITNEVNLAKNALSAVKDLYGRVSATKFGPLALKTVRESMIEKGWSRKHINKQVDRVKRVFKWAVSEEMIPGSVYEDLRSVSGLRKGRTQARETSPVRPVDDAVVEATLFHLPEIVADMVRLQRLTGCRPSELCHLRPCDIDRSEEVWKYHPQIHKTEHYDRDRTVYIGPKSQKILLKYLARDESMHCFRPCDSEKKRRNSISRLRSVPLSQGNTPGSNRKANPKRTPGAKYTKDSYRRAIHRACEKAGVEKWSPNRLRHSAATEIRKQYGLEGSQIVLGHSSADITQIYAERDASLGSRIAKEMG